MRAGKKHPCHGHEVAGSAGTDNEISVYSRTTGSGSYLQYFLLYLNLTVPMHAKVIISHTEQQGPEDRYSET